VVINLQCDRDHPTQSLADLMHLKETFGSLESLRGKKVAMSWAHSPSYGKPLSVPQGIIGLLTRFGMDVVLAHPPGYDLMPEINALAERQAREAGGTFEVTHSMEEAFAGAHVVYPKSWAPFEVMQARTRYLRAGKADKIDELEREAMESNARFRNWECTEELMATTAAGQALYMHCLPADITGVSCAHGEVAASVFDRYRVATYKEAEHKPYVMAAMVLLARFQESAAVLSEILQRAELRKVQV
jgi:knotted carbamoyltransferase YgeW